MNIKKLNKETQPRQKIIEDLINLHATGKLDDAKKKILSYIKKFPKAFTLFNILGAVLTDQNKLEEAVNYHQKAIKINPNYAEGYNNLGVALQKLKQLDEAVNNYKIALKLKPNLAQAYNNLATALKDLNKFDEALINCKKAIDLKPDFANAHNNLGTVLKDLNRMEESYECLNKAIKLKTDYAEAYYNLGIVLKKLGKIEESVENYQKAVKIKPGYHEAYNNYLFNLNYLTKYDNQYYIAVAKEFRHGLKKIENNLCTPYQYKKHPKKIKIGFISGDFKEHPVGFFISDTLKYLKKNFELFAYSNFKKKDNLTVKIKSHFTNWREIVDLNDLEVINEIRKDGINVLFDLSGHSANNRLPIFINKPAPVQISWVGYAASTGIPEIDYIIGDPYVTPPESKSQFVENILCLPNIWCCLSKPDFEAKKMEFAPAIKNGFVTFGCFNNLDKLNEKVINLWAKILDSVPNSRLVLKNSMLKNKHAKKKIIDQFEKRKINIKKLVLEEGSPRKELMESYNKIDITLDPFPYSGGTSSFESIWMAVPVLTKKGSKFISCTTESINRNIEMSDWVAHDENEYVIKAMEFSKNLKQLSKIKKKLLLMAPESPLFNASLFAEQFKNLIWQIWEKFNNKNI
jgi:predicted O-linked N-acetylglucosamine transferase (SPINDLY family)